MFRLWLSFACFVMFATTVQADTVPRVVVSIAPIHSLVAGVMAGVAEPELLVKGSRSPHGYMLKPSQARSLQRADVIVWVGEGVEGFLVRPLANDGASKTIIKLIDGKGMHLLAARKAGVWQAAQQDHIHHHDDIDAHLWLDPANALTIVRLVVIKLSELDSQNAARYKANGKRLQAKLLALDDQLKQKLASVGQIPYLVFHDAYHYFERAYGLNSVGAILIDLDRKPGARRLKQLRHRVEKVSARCVFSEPQFPSKLIQVVAEDTGLKTAMLDPMGMGLAPAETLYFELMRNLGQRVFECLGD